MDKKAFFEHFYKTYFDAIESYCFRLIGDKTLATDFAQEGFSRFWEKIDVVSYNEKSSLSYIYITVRNICYDYYRDHANTIHESIDEDTLKIMADDATFLDEVTRMETIRNVQTMINRLNGRKLEIIKLCLQGKKNAEIAELLGISVNTVKSTKREAYDDLRNWFGPSYYKDKEDTEGLSTQYLLFALLLELSALTSYAS